MVVNNATHLNVLELMNYNAPTSFPVTSTGTVWSSWSGSVRGRGRCVSSNKRSRESSASRKRGRGGLRRDARSGRHDEKVVVYNDSTTAHTVYFNLVIFRERFQRYVR